METGFGATKVQPLNFHDFQSPGHTSSSLWHFLCQGICNEHSCLEIRTVHGHSLAHNAGILEIDIKTVALLKPKDPLVSKEAKCLSITSFFNS